MMNIKPEEMTNFTIKIDKKTREDYSELCKEIGLSMSAATLALIRQAVRSQSMFFSLRDENGFTPSEAAEKISCVTDISVLMEKLKNSRVISADIAAYVLIRRTE